MGLCHLATISDVTRGGLCHLATISDVTTGGLCHLATISDVTTGGLCHLATIRQGGCFTHCLGLGFKLQLSNIKMFDTTVKLIILPGNLSWDVPQNFSHLYITEY